MILWNKISDCLCCQDFIFTLLLLSTPFTNIMSVTHNFLITSMCICTEWGRKKNIIYVNKEKAAAAAAQQVIFSPAIFLEATLYNIAMYLKKYLSDWLHTYKNE